MWEIEVKWMSNSCFLGKQWFDFAEDIELKVGDTKVLYRIPSSGPYIVNVCIFNGKEQMIDDARGMF